MKKILIPISLLLLRNEIISLAVVAVLMIAGAAWLLNEAAKGGAF